MSEALGLEGVTRAYGGGAVPVLRDRKSVV